LLEADRRPAPTVLCDPTGGDATRHAEALAAEGVETLASPFLPGVLRVVRGNPAHTRTFRENGLYVQDEASQLVPRLAGTPGPAPVIDLCAAPGGKTLHLAARAVAGTLVIACDRSPRRMRRLGENLGRPGLGSVARIVADVEAGPPPVADGSASVVLLDAPCTGSGTMRRRPELRLRLRPGDPARMARRQAVLLDHAAAAVARGGRLVYAVCSVAPEEGEGVVGAFLDGHPEFGIADVGTLLPEPCRGLVGADGALRTSSADDLDGFYAVALDRVRG
jgi:16S rRNA (cytosine967-C5)-methyltransferase